MQKNVGEDPQDWTPCSSPAARLVLSDAKPRRSSDASTGPESRQEQSTASERSAQQALRKPGTAGGRARYVEVGGSGGLSGGRALAAGGTAGGRKRDCGAGAVGSEAVPSAGWREVAYELDVSGGQQHE
jgi:hypothetical protein